MDDICKIADGTARVVVWRPGSDYRRTVERALFRPYDRAAAERDRVVPQSRGYWYLGGSEHEKPLPGDRIETGEGEDWLIEKLVYSRLAGNWRCAVSRYETVFGPEEFADLLKPVYVKSAAGSLAERFTTIKTGIPSKFSAEEYTTADGHHPDGRTSGTGSRHRPHARKYRCFFLCRERIEPPENGLLRRGDGTLWEIVRIGSPPFEGAWTEGEIVRMEN